MLTIRKSVAERKNAYLISNKRLCRPILASSNRLVVEVEIQAEHITTKGTLHGGQTASFADIIIARALSLAVPDRPMASVELSVSYLNPVKLGDVVEVEARVLKTGRSLAFTEAELRRRSDGVLIAKNEIAVTGKQTMAILEAQKNLPESSLNGILFSRGALANLASLTANQANGLSAPADTNGDLNTHFEELLEELESLKQIINFNNVGTGARPVFASPARIIVEIDVHKGNVNAEGKLDDGFLAGFTDVITARAVGINIREHPMVSVNISVSYLKPVLAGDVLEAEAKMIDDEGALVYAVVEYRRRSDGRQVAIGRHTVAKLPTPPPGVDFERY